MTKKETIMWLNNLKKEIGQSQYQALWYYAEAIDAAIEALNCSEIPNSSDLISRHGVSAWLSNMGHDKLADMVMEERRFSSAESKTGKWIKTKYGYTWTENNVCLNFVDYYDAKEDGE